MMSTKFVSPVFKFVATCFTVISLVLLIAYIFQPRKMGKGSDMSTRYMLVSDWPQLPEDLRLGNPVGLGIDSFQYLVVFHRGERSWPLMGPMPTTFIKEKTVLIIDRETGKLQGSWGDNRFIMPHGLHVDNNNNIWLTDVGLHQVFKFTYNGQLLFKIGEAGVPGSGNYHFNRPTDVAVAPDGTFYVSDGYRNSRIVKYSPTGRYLFQWGRRGTGAGEFNIPHGIDLDHRGMVYVADRENNRVQVFDSAGQFRKYYYQPDFGQVHSVSFHSPSDRLFLCDDLRFLQLFHRGSDVITLDSKGTVQSRFGRSGGYSGTDCWYHDIETDIEGNVYAGDLLHNRIQLFKRMGSRPSP